MPQRAAWRTRPDDPRTTLGWFLRDRAFRRLPLIVALPLTILVGAAVVGWSPWAVLLLPLVALHVRLPTPKAEIASLATLPAPGPAFACRVEVRRDGVLLGEDEGVLTFVGSWLHFAGLRIEFSLSRSDTTASYPLGGFNLVRYALARYQPETIARSPRVRGSKVEVALPGGTTVAFDPRGAWAGTDYFEDTPAVQTGFQGAFRFWATHAPAAGRGKPVLPPSEIHPSGIARAWRDLALAWGALFVVELFVYAVARHQSWIGVFGIAILTPISRLMEAYRLRRLKRRALPARGTT